MLANWPSRWHVELSENADSQREPNELTPE